MSKNTGTYYRLTALIFSNNNTLIEQYWKSKNNYISLNFSSFILLIKNYRIDFWTDNLVYTWTCSRISEKVVMTLETDTTSMCCVAIATSKKPSFNLKASRLNRRGARGLQATSNEHCKVILDPNPESIVQF